MDQAEQLRNMIKMQGLQDADSQTTNSHPVSVQSETPQEATVQPIVSHEMAKSTAKVITVTSGKGGVGKSSLSVNLAIQLRRMGKRVLIFDADFGLANVEIMLGIRPKYNLADLMYKEKNIEDIITYGPEGVGFISGGSGINELANLTRDQVVALIQSLGELDKIADVIIIDTGAGISDAVLEFVAASEEVLLVTTPEPTSITDSYALLKTLNRKTSYRPEKTIVKMVANQVRSEKEATELFEKLGVVVGKFLDIQVELIGSVPRSKSMQRAVMCQAPVSICDPESDAAKSFQKIAYRIEDVMLEKKPKEGIVKLFSSVIRMRFGKK